MKKVALFAAMLTGAMLIAGPAQAMSYGTVKAEWTGVRTPAAGAGGVFQFNKWGDGGTFTNGTLVAPSPFGQFIGMCLETNNTIGPGDDNTWNLSDLADATVGPNGSAAMGIDRAKDIALLIGYVLNGNLANAITPPGTADIDALQQAIWAIVAGPTGAYSSSNAVAQGWLTNLNGGNQANWQAAAGLFALTSLSSTANLQDMLVQVVPIPAAVWLLGSGLLGLFGLARRKTAVATA